MSVHHAEDIVSPFGIENLAAWNSKHNAVFFPSTKELSNYCETAGEKHSRFRRFFRIPASYKCFALSVTLNRLTIRAQRDRESPVEFIGKAEFTIDAQKRYQTLVNLWLPQGQTVFPSHIGISRLAGPAAVEVQQRGMFEFSSGAAPRQVFLQATPNTLQIGGVTKDGIDPDLLPSIFDRSISGWK